MEFNPKTLSTPQRLQLMQMAERALAQNPKNGEALRNLGMLLLHEKRFEQAAGYLKRALSVLKKNEAILQALAQSLYMSKQYKESAKYRRKLCEVNARNPQYWAEYAEILIEVGKVSQAEQAFAKAERLAPKHPDLLYKKADFYRKQGRYDEANAILQNIQQIKPGHPESLYLYTHSRKFNGDEAAEYDAHIKSALPNTQDLAQISSLNYAGGKIWQDAGDVDKAFKYYKQANDIRLKELNPNFTSAFDNAKSVFTKGFLSNRSSLGSKSKAPVFILGMVRSGTTLTESLCGAHSSITAGDEMIHLSAIPRSLGMDAPQTAKVISALNAYSDADINAMAADYVASVKSFTAQTPHFTDKLPANFMNIGFIRMILPNAKIIHCRRHPIDNCLSIYTNSMRSHHISYKSDLTRLGLYYRQYWQLMRHWREHIKGGFHEVYYEDMVANTQLNARNMIEYLDLEWEDGVMDRKGSQKTIRTLSAWQARQPIYTSSAGKWRKYEKHLAPLIDALGSVVDEYENELAALQETKT